MTIKRSTKCGLGCSNRQKLEVLSTVLAEYGQVVNQFIEHFWSSGPVRKGQLLKPVVDLPATWLSARLRKVAAREALDMISAARRRWKGQAVRPTHRGARMCISSTIATLEPAKGASEFDAWLHLSSIGNGIVLDLPVRFHRHFHKLARRGRRLSSYIITKKDVQLSFELEIPEPRTEPAVGVDTGINVLASLSTGEQLGKDLRAGIDKINRRQHGSLGQARAARALRQRIDEVARDVVTRCGTVIVEDLKGICTRTKTRVGRTTRRLLSRWQVRHWLTRLGQRCQTEGRSFRMVSARYTSQTCPRCGHVEQGNRAGQRFLCRRCGHADNADINAAKNLLSRFLTGAYGPCCKALA